MNVDFTKIKYSPADIETTLRWEEPGETGIDRHELVSKDEPHPDFIAALEALKVVVCMACGITPSAKEIAGTEYDDLDLDPRNQLSAFVEMTIRGVTLKGTAGPDGEMVEGATITALRTLDWCAAPLVINTPFAPVEQVPHHATERLIQDLVREAENFLGGKRKQPDLFAEEITRAVRDMSPKEGSGIDTVTITTDGVDPVVLTSETRRNADRALKTMRGARA